MGKNNADDAPSHQDSPKRRYRRLGFVTDNCLIPKSCTTSICPFAQRSQLSGQLVSDDKHVVQTRMAAAVRAATRGTLRRGLLQGSHPKYCLQLSHPC